MVMFLLAILFHYVVSRFGPDSLRRAAEISHGRLAAPGMFPHLVALLVEDISSDYHAFCGGALISPSWVLTAAHCLDWAAEGDPNPDPSDLYVQLNTTSLNNGASGILVQVAAYFINPSYNNVTMIGDVALIQLTSSVAESANGPRYGDLQPVSAFSAFNVDGRRLVVAGWGDTSASAAPPNDCMYIQVPLDVPASGQTKCGVALGGTLDSTMMCAGDGCFDSCQGDSGGPIFYVSDVGAKRWTIVGVVSFGPQVDCAAKGAFGVYAKTAYTSLLSWISSTVTDMPGVSYLPALTVGITEYLTCAATPSTCNGGKTVAQECPDVVPTSSGSLVFVTVVSLLGVIFAMF